MSTRALSRVAACLGACLLGCSPPAAPNLADADLSWMIGCWRLETAVEKAYERWRAGPDGKLLGEARTIRFSDFDGGSVETEEVTIERTGDGRTFNVKPSGQPFARFTLVEAGPGRAVFENPEHDFPQRITYASPKPGVLEGRIDGTIDGKTKAAKWRYEGFACERWSETEVFLRPGGGERPGREGASGSEE